MTTRAFTVICGVLGTWLVAWSLPAPAAAQCPPNTPGGFSATSVCGGVNLNWGNVSGADWYEVWRNTSNNFGAATRIGLPANSDFSDVTALPGQTYHYWITSWRVACLPGNNRSSAIHTSGTRGGPPNPPGGIAATDGVCSDVTVSWNSAAGALTYTVWRDINGDQTVAVPMETTALLQWTDLTALPGVTYTYWVTAQNLCGGSGFGGSNTGSRGTGPAAPGGLAASDGTACLGVNVDWNASAGALTYTVLRDINGNQAVAVPIATTPTTQWADLTALPGVTYTYWVMAENLCGASATSGSNTGYRGAGPLPPANVAATDGTVCAGVNVSWDAAAGATGYTLMRDINGDQAVAVPVGATPNLSLNDPTALTGATYTYWVIAANPCGSSGLSDPDTGAAGFGPLAPQDIVATDGTDCFGVEVNWTSADNATLHTVFRSIGDDPLTAVPVGSLPRDHTWLDVTAAPGTTYTYWVRASNDCGLGALSGPNTGWRGDFALGPTNIQATDNTECASVQITWEPTLVANSYTVHRNFENNFLTATPLGGTLESSWSDTTALPGITYWYWVVASSQCGTSGQGTPETGSRALPLEISQQPESVSVNSCQTAHLSTNALDGGAPAYQWRRNGQAIADGPGGASLGGGSVHGSDNRILSIVGPRAADSGAYTCDVADDCDSFTTDPAALFVCAADFNCDETVSIDDLFLYINGYFTGVPAADFNGVGGVTIDDLFLYINAYFVGC